MKIIQPIYPITLTIILIGFPLLIFIKVSQNIKQPLHITIVGSTIESSLLVYYLKKLNRPQLINLTLIRNEMINNNTQSINYTMLDHRLISFCGIEPNLMDLLKDFDLQYMVKPYGLYFNQNQKLRYKLTEVDSNPVSNIFNYGFSHFAAKNLFDNFAKHIQNVNPNKFNQRTLQGLLKKIIPDKAYESGHTYLSEIVGLDQLYLSDYINPIISASFRHDANSLSTMYQLLPLYCKNSLVLLLDEIKLQEKLLNSNNNITIIQNQQILNYEKMQGKQKRHKIELTLTNQTKITTNILVFVQDYQFLQIKKGQKKEQHRTLVDGILSGDEQFPDIYTLFYSNIEIASITRICAKECNGYRNSLYIVVSKAKIRQKHLTMFDHHQIIKQKIKWQLKTSLPVENIRFQQTQGIYRIQETEIISQNFQFKQSVFRNVANIITEKYLS